MLKKNSIFMRLLVPVILIVLIQSLLIASTLYVNGTVQTLEQNAIETLEKNNANRVSALQNNMIHNWSNITHLTETVDIKLGNYLDRNGLTIDEFLLNDGFVTEMLSDLSNDMLNALRLTSSTGTFIYFIGPEGYEERPVSYPGVYYRDLDPTSTPVGFQDILYLRGPVSVARRNNIPLDVMWTQRFELTPDLPVLWRSHRNPLEYSAQNPDANPAHSAYWDIPHTLSGENKKDANRFISYTRPIVYAGKPIGVIGTEVQITHLENHIPATDFDLLAQSGFMLLKYDISQGDETLNCEIIDTTGSYIKRMLSTNKTIELRRSQRYSHNNLYTVVGGEFEDAQVVVSPIQLYNLNAPFANEQWALAAIGTDSALFESANSVRRDVIISTLLAALVGVLLLTIIIRIISNPLNKVVQQIVNNAPNEPIEIGATRTYEIDLLSTTLNEMKYKNRAMELELREEQERYLIALESATDTFMEYDVAIDSFMLYYFSERRGKPTLASATIGSFAFKVRSGQICHEDDVEKLRTFISSEQEESIEVRFLVHLFPEIIKDVSDGDYYWFTLKASYLYNDASQLSKIIGIAREITQEKLLERTQQDAQRRDRTTGMYKREYGLSLAKRRARKLAASGADCSICVWQLRQFDRLETYYSRVYGGMLIRRLSQQLNALCSDDDVAVRMSNDEFLIVCKTDDHARFLRDIERTFERIGALYIGENPDLTLDINAGISKADGADVDAAIHRAYVALASAVERRVPYVDCEDANCDPSADAAVPSLKPVSIDLDASIDGVVPLAFDLFEHSSDLKSVITLSLFMLGDLFTLNQIIICDYDQDFGANQIYAQWTDGQLPQAPEKLERFNRTAFAALEQLLGENGTCFYRPEGIADMDKDVCKMLCIAPGEASSGFCCMLYVNGAHAGRIIFKSVDPDHVWTEQAVHSLLEIAKIASAHINIEKSSSANRAKSDFLSRMSHEIRTPMNAIIGMTSIARDRVDDKERLMDSLNKIDFSSRHLLALINDVLDMSRIESGKMRIESAPFSLDVFVDALNTLMRPPIEAKGIQFEVVQRYERGHVMGDEYRLRQVLVNLLGNANKFTPVGGKITLGIEMCGGPDAEGEAPYRFSVRDTGIGISKADQQLVFKAFEQSQTAEQKSGTGLGLAISSNIITAMDSHIELDSEIGKGSEFHFTLRMPLVEAEPEAVTTTSPSEQYDFTGKRLLLAEDNEINKEIALYLLENVGFDVDVAPDGQVAVDLFMKSAPGYYCAILMDIQMPVMDGLAATREIRKNDAHPDARTIPIIAMTANAFDEDMRKSIESGMNGHLAKPIDIDQLYQKLTSFVSLNADENEKE